MDNINKVFLWLYKLPNGCKKELRPIAKILKVSDAELIEMIKNNIDLGLRNLTFTNDYLFIKKD